MSKVAAATPPVLVGRSPQMEEILHRVEKLGHSRSPVLLLGETGTGKEVLARAIHHVNPVGVFVPIDCAALNKGLTESELFGHVKGAFTGAVANKSGLLELARAGTAFFDEIGEVPMDIQVKLLRVLQDKEIRPVGSLLWQKVSFRIIAATNRDLAQEVERGNFRRDLYYRLNVVTLRVPPLRERKEDIPALVEHFLARYGANRVLTQEILDAMLSYEWPGNVRELENCIERLLAVSSGPELRMADLPTSLQNHVFFKGTRPAAVAAEPVRRPPAAAPGPEGEPPVVPLKEVERRTIVAALTYTKGDRLKAAHLLGIGRTTLYRKLKEYRIKLPTAS